MRLCLDFPEPWRVNVAPDGRRVAVLEQGGEPRAVVTYGPMRVQPDDRRDWYESVVLSQLDRDCALRIRDQAELESRVGWPIRVLEADATGADGELVEARLAVFYDFMEHAAAAVFKTGSVADREALRDELLRIAVSGRPDWQTAAASLFDLWDLDGERSYVDQVATQRSTDEIAEAVEQLAVGRVSEAVAALELAVARDPEAEPAHFYLGVALGRLGRHSRAAGAFARALELSPDNLETLYNLGQARFSAGDFEAALADFTRAFELSNDFLTLRKKIQCLYALGRYTEGQAARHELREIWAASDDPRAALVREYVYHQIRDGDLTVHAIEPLGSPGLSFDLIDDQDRPAGVRIELKKSRDRFALTLLRGDQPSVLAELDELPSYPDLLERVLSHMASSVGKDRGGAGV